MRDFLGNDRQAKVELFAKMVSVLNAKPNCIFL